MVDFLIITNAAKVAFFVFGTERATKLPLQQKCRTNYLARHHYLFTSKYLLLHKLVYAVDVSLDAGCHDVGV